LLQSNSSEDVRKVISQGFKSEGDIVALLGETRNDLDASEYEQAVLKMETAEFIERGSLPKLDLNKEKTVQQTCLQLANEALLKSAHDTSEGGLAVTIAESCFSSLNRDSIGAQIVIQSKEGVSLESLLFGETPSRIVISFAPEHLERVEQITKLNGCSFQILGVVTGKKLNIKVDGELVISDEIAELENLWRNALEKYLK
jgi:phosphoribosylformylglycinamidine (FGAM) synthase-like enzyme